MVVLVVVVLALKLVQNGVHHTFGGGHDIVFTSLAPPLPPFLLVRGRLNLLPNVLKGLDQA